MMCVDAANCNGNCSECQHNTIKRLRAENERLRRERDEMARIAGKALREITELAGREK